MSRSADRRIGGSLISSSSTSCKHKPINTINLECMWLWTSAMVLRKKLLFMISSSKLPSFGRTHIGLTFSQGLRVGSTIDWNTVSFQTSCPEKGSRKRLRFTRWSQIIAVTYSKWNFFMRAAISITHSTARSSWVCVAIFEICGLTEANCSLCASLRDYWTMEEAR